MNDPQRKLNGLDKLAWIVVFGVIGFVAVDAVPKWVKARAASCCAPCINNLRQIDGAKNECALELNKTNGQILTAEDIKPYIKLDAKGRIPHCPGWGRYTIGKVGEPPTCSLGKLEPNHTLP